MSERLHEIAFVGVGTMGAPMAANIARRGYALTVWNRSPARAQPLVDAGARLAATPADAARGADAVVLMLSDPPPSHAVVDAGARRATLPPGCARARSSSTCRPSIVDTARAVDAKVRARGGRFVDAPVSGTRKPAVDGTLVIMAGGAPDDVARARPLLECDGPRRSRRRRRPGHGRRSWCSTGSART